MKEERKIFNFESKILNELTLEREGFDPRLIGYQKKYIWAICRYCGKEHRIKGRNFKLANSACHKECRIKEQVEVGSPFKNDTVRQKAKQTMIERYGVDKPSKSIELSQKRNENRKLAQKQIEQTNLEKYGVKNVFQSEEIKEKIKETNLEKYGVENPQQNKEIKEKSNITLKNTILENNEQIKNKRAKTNLEKYGFANPMQNEYIKNQAESTNLKKYNVNNPLKNDIIFNKTKETLFKNYGVFHPLQNNELKEKSQFSFAETVKENENNYYKLINILRSKEFWKEIEKGEPLKKLCDQNNINWAATRSYMVKEEFSEKYYNLYTFPKLQKQKEIQESIKEIVLDLEVSMNCRDIISPLELDIYIPDKKFAIEFNGSYWHSEAVLDPKEAKKKHITKTKLCQEKGIRLFHIFENIWDNRKEQIIGFLRSALGQNENRINGRDCEIKENLGLELCEKYHIQGKPNNFIKTFDLVYKEEWIGSMVFGKHHRQNIEGNPIVLSRLVFKNNTTIQGGVSKLFNRALIWAKENNYDRIISWSDNSWTEGNIYKVLNFELMEEFPADYFYWDSKTNKYLSKQSQKKSYTGCPKETTERDFCFEKGLFRIYDCGKKRWEYKL